MSGAKTGEITCRSAWDRLSAIPTEPECLTQELEKYLRHLGVETFLISLLNDHPSYGLPARHGILRSYPEDWMKYYFKLSYERIDPVRLECFKPGPFSWQELMKQERFNHTQRRMMNEAAEAGLRHGVAVGVCSANGQYAGVGFASKKSLDITRNRLSLYHMLSVHFAQCFLTLTKTKDSQKAQEQIPVLTRQQHEVLKWIASGLLPHQVADRLAINKRTVNFHLENIYRKLGVFSRAQAISKAIQLGLVHAYPELLENA